MLILGNSTKCKSEHVIYRQP